MKTIRMRCRAPRRCGKAKQYIHVQQHKYNKTKSERKGQENRSSTKAPSRQPQQLWYE